jgi:prepilin-type N-terminal cleavage/methylation domain-containing protein
MERIESDTMLPRRRSSGFTLIELLVVIAIIGILSAVGLLALNGAREKARDVAKKSDLKQLATALLLYHDANDNRYPSSASGIDTWTSESSPQTALPADAQGCPACDFYTALVGNSKFIARLPNSPTVGPTALSKQFWYISCVGDGSSSQASAQQYVLLTEIERPADSVKNWWVFSSKKSSGEEIAPTGSPCT